MNTDYVELKIVLVGNQSVGKSCIVNQFINNEFKSDIAPTLGAAFTSKTLVIESHKVCMQLWDTAGQEKYRGMTPMYYRGGKVAIIVFSIENRESFDAIPSWINDLRAHAPKDIIVFIIGNKTDLDSVRVIKAEEGMDLAQQNDATYMEVSAKTGQNIDILFDEIPKSYIRKNIEIHHMGEEKLIVKTNTNQSCC